jgi:hypothetical protein
MNDDPKGFAETLRQIEQGDNHALDELIGCYGDQLRVMVQRWMRGRGPELTRLIEPADICQVVWANLCKSLRAGRCEFAVPDDLLKLLNVMARNELSEQVRKLRAARRDTRRDVAIDRAEEVPSDDTTPSGKLNRTEQVDAVYSKMTEEERRIGELRMLDYDWPTIAERLGGSAEGRRKQWARVVQRLNLNS